MQTRKNIRLHPDLYKEGWFFVTVVLKHRKNLFSSNGKLLVEKTFNEISRRFPGWIIDTTEIMPDHVHFIVHAVGAGFTPPAEAGAASRIPTSLGDFVGTFKSLVAYQFRRELGIFGSLWQRSYYDHIIRSEEALNRIRIYIKANPYAEKIDWDNVMGDML